LLWTYQKGPTHNTQFPFMWPLLSREEVSVSCISEVIKMVLD
jgi:hypothetical protein